MFFEYNENIFDLFASSADQKFESNLMINNLFVVRGGVGGGGGKCSFQ